MQTARQQQAIVPSGGEFEGAFIDHISGRVYYSRKKRHPYDTKARGLRQRMPWYRRRGGYYGDEQPQQAAYGAQQQQQQQQQPMYGGQQDQQYGDSYGEEYGEDYQYGEEYSNEASFDSFDEEYQQQLQQKGQFDKAMVPQPQMPAHHAMFANMTDEELARPANVKFRKVTFEASRTIKPSQFIDKETKKLRSKGELVFTVDKHLEPIKATHRQDVFGVNNIKAKQDLVRRIDVRITSDYKGKLLLSFPTVGAIGTELFRNGANHVNFTIPAGALSLDVPYTDSFERSITNGVVAFTNIFDDPSPDTMENKICHVSGRDYSLVPFTHSVIHYWNMEHMNDGLAITEKSLNPAFGGDVKMLTSDVKRLLKVAQENVTSKISLGNVTTDPVIVISAIEPTESKQMALRAKEGVNGEKSYQFMGLADATYYLGKNVTEAKKEKFMDTPFKFDISVTFEYLKVDGSTPLELNK